MPRQKKSIEAHKLNGTYKKTRHGAKTIKVPANRPEAPIHLSEEEKVYFNQLADQLEAIGILTLADKLILELTACTIQEHVELSQFIKDNGRTYENETMAGTVQYKPRPEAQMLQDCSKRLAALYKELGLTHQARSKMTIPEKRSGYDPIAAIMGRPQAVNPFEGF